MTDLPTLHITAADLNAGGVYIGPADVTDWPGHIEIAANLGVVRFKSSLAAKGSIRAMNGTGIHAGAGIKAGTGIEAGTGIKAGGGIEAGLAIIATAINCRLRIFAGICRWRLPTLSEMEIRAEVQSGTVAFGTVVSPKAEVAS